MATVVAARPGLRARAFGDPALALTVGALWLLLALFVLYPLAMLLARVFVDQGQLTVAGLAAIVGDRHQIAAFRNSLVLGVLVGVVGTVLGFVFAFAATRCRLPRVLVRLIDKS